MKAAEQTLAERTEGVGPGLLRLAAFWMVIATLGMTAFFWDGIVRVVTSWARPEYSFGPLVPVVSAYMLLHELRVRPPTENGGSATPGFIIVVVGLLIGFLGNLTQISHIIAYGLFVVVGGIALIVAGFRQGLSYWPGWIHLLFMLPLPSFIYYTISNSLQLISSQVGVAIVQAAGIPVYLSGNVIDLGAYQLQVAEACSGLRYLFPLMSFGYLFAVLYRGPLWQKFTLFFLSIPITVLMNSVRIGVIGILVNYYGIEQAEGFLHWFEGWIIFISCTILLFIAAILLQKMQPNPESSLNVLDLEFDGLLTPFSWLRKTQAKPALIAAALLILSVGVLWRVTPESPPPMVQRESLANFPDVLGDWQAHQYKLDDRTTRNLGADEYVLADYLAKGEAAEINVFISYYNSITDGTDTHSPEGCLPGDGWEIAKWQRVKFQSENGVAPFSYNRAVIQKGRERQLVYYWFEQRGRRLDTDWAAKYYTLLDATLSGRSDGGLVRLITPLVPGEPQDAADARLQRMMEKITPLLPRYIPG